MLLIIPLIHRLTWATTATHLCTPYACISSKGLSCVKAYYNLVRHLDLHVFVVRVNDRIENRWRQQDLALSKGTQASSRQIKPEISIKLLLLHTRRKQMCNGRPSSTLVRDEYHDLNHLVVSVCLIKKPPASSSHSGALFKDFLPFSNAGNLTMMISYNAVVLQRHIPLSLVQHCECCHTTQRSSVHITNLCAYSPSILTMLVGASF